jgi:cytochrome P450
MSRHESSTAGGPIPTDVDITDAGFKADPFTFYGRLREEAPVHPVRWARGSTAWVVTRHADVEETLVDPRLMKNQRTALTPAQLRKVPRIPKIFAAVQSNLLGTDGDDHDRLRRLVHRAFTPRRIAVMRDDVAELSDQLLRGARRHGGMDLIADFAVPIPLIVIARVMGVPEQDVAKFRTWTGDLMSIAQRPVRGPIGVLRFIRYLKALIAMRTREPQDDLVSALVQARDEGDQLSTDEIVAMLLILLTAGHETTVNLIGVGTLALLENPEQADRWRTDEELARPAVLRFTSPVETATERWAAETVEIAGTTVPQGSLVLAAVASANRDPAVFEDADRLDLGRTPNPHLAFGKGSHYCLGASLARLEAEIAVPALLRAAPDLRRADPGAPVDWRGTPVVRGLGSLPVRV